MLFSFFPFKSAGIYFAQCKVSLGQAWAQPQRINIFLFGILHPSQHVVIFSHGLVRARRVGISGQQCVNGLLGEQTARPAEIVKNVRVVGVRSQCSLQVLNSLRKLSSLYFRDPQRGFIWSSLQMRNRLGRIALGE